MDATRRSLRADPGHAGQAAARGDSAAPGIAAVRARVASLFDRVGLGDARVAVALSGGRDSMALLDAALAGGTDGAIAAIHVHHGLSPNADAWADFCVDQCRRRGVTCKVRHVSVVAAPRRSLEADACEQRRTALTEAAGALGAAAVLLAHHADDQAETLLLQLLRGAGPRGLAAMAEARNASGLWWLRPFLDLPRTAIDDYVRARAIAYIEDESNASARHWRNALRH
ncbi:MAG: tRNA lysidine(34) synthetase TilS, partial [Casimicrobiaceae bacterium]